MESQKKKTLIKKKIKMGQKTPQMEIGQKIKKKTSQTQKKITQNQSQNPQS
jgi:hypothetical protein